MENGIVMAYNKAVCDDNFDFEDGKLILQFILYLIIYLS